MFSRCFTNRTLFSLKYNNHHSVMKLSLLNDHTKIIVETLKHNTIDLKVSIDNDINFNQVENLFHFLGFQIIKNSNQSTLSQISFNKKLTINIQKRNDKTNFKNIISSFNSSKFHINSININTYGNYEENCKHVLNYKMSQFSITHESNIDKECISNSSMKLENNVRFEEEGDNSSSLDLKSTINSISIKELVIPCLDNHNSLYNSYNYHIHISEIRSILYSHLCDSYKHQYPDLFAILSFVNSSNDNNIMYIRILPTKVCCIVLLVNDLNECIKLINNRNDIKWDWIGCNGYNSNNNNNNQRQITLSSDLLCGIDIRLTENNEITNYFNESTDILLDGTISSIQSVHVLGNNI